MTPNPIKLSGIQADEVDTVWADVTPYLQNVLPRSHGEYTIDSVRHALLKRDMQLWIGYEDSIVYVGITELVSYPSGKLVAIISMLAGERVDEWLNHMDLFENWARDVGAESIRILGRPGWKKKLPGFRPIYSVLERTL